MSLHYLVNLEMLIRACYTVELLQKETPEVKPPQLWPQKSPDLYSVDNIMLEMLQQKVCKTRITALELSTTLLTNGLRSDDI